MEKKTVFSSVSSVASVNNDGINCGGGPDAYNAHNGGWLRGGTYDKGITNQSSIDLSPAVNKMLSETFIKVCRKESSRKHLLDHLTERLIPIMIISQYDIIAMYLGP